MLSVRPIGNRRKPGTAWDTGTARGFIAANSSLVCLNGQGYIHPLLELHGSSVGQDPLLVLLTHRFFQNMYTPTVLHSFTLYTAPVYSATAYVNRKAHKEFKPKDTVLFRSVKLLRNTCIKIKLITKAVGIVVLTPGEQNKHIAVLRVKNTVGEKNPESGSAFRLPQKSFHYFCPNA